MTIKRFRRPLSAVLLLSLLLPAVLLLSSCKKNPFVGKTMVCLGDSITSGYLIDTSYPEEVRKILRLGTVCNYGIPGSTLTTAGGRDPFVDRFGSMIDADIVSVLFAGNDATYHVPIGEETDFGTDTVFGALNLLIDGLREKYPNAYLFFITPLKNENAPAIVPYVEATRTACQNHGVDLLDQFGDDVKYNSGNDTVDGCHPTQAYVTSTLAPRIADFLKAHYQA